MPLESRNSHHHDAPRGSGESPERADARLRADARTAMEARARAEREARLNAVDASKIYWG